MCGKSETYLKLSDIQANFEDTEARQKKAAEASNTTQKLYDQNSAVVNPVFSNGQPFSSLKVVDPYRSQF